MLHLEIEKERTFPVLSQVNVCNVWRIFRKWISQIALFNFIECHVLLHILSIEALFTNRETLMSSIQWTH